MIQDFNVPDHIKLELEAVVFLNVFQIILYTVLMDEKEWS